MLYINGEKVAQVVPGGGDILFDNSGTDLSSTNIQDAIVEVDGKIDSNIISTQDFPVTMSANGTVQPFTYYGLGNISDFVNTKKIIGVEVIVAGSGSRAMVNIKDATVYVFSMSSDSVTVRLSGIPL